jgi:hypothetical protein
MTVLETVTLVTAIVGAVTGVSGALMGGLSLWLEFQGRRVKLLVTPKVAIDHGEMRISTTESTSHVARSTLPKRICIQVVNLSEFPITVYEVGIGSEGRKRQAILLPELVGAEKLPVRLEPRAGFTAYSATSAFDSGTLPGGQKAYAKTDCGHTFYGTSPAFREYLAIVDRHGLMDSQ